MTRPDPGSVPLWLWAVTLTGAICFPLIPILWLHLRKRRSRERGDRPPMVTKLLHPAGHSLTNRIEKLDAKLEGYLWIMVGAGGMLSALSIPFASILYAALRHRLNWSLIRSSHTDWVLIGMLTDLVASVCGLVYGISKSIGNLKEWAGCKLGLRGEQAVAEALTARQVLKAGYRSFHDVPGDGAWNVDHIVVGPGGVFVLETKTRTKKRNTETKQGHQVGFDGEVLRFPTWADHETVRQVRRNAEWVANMVRDLGCDEASVQPLVIIPGWYVESTGNFAVKAMNSDYLAKYLPSLRSRLSPDEIDRIEKRIEERCRTLEF